MSVTVCLEDEIDISRGDMLVRADNLPHVRRRFDATLVLDARAAARIRRTAYLLKHTTQTGRARVETVRYRVDMNTLEQRAGRDAGLERDRRCRDRDQQPLFFDPYRGNRATGSFILIDPATNATVAAGMIRGLSREVGDVTRAGQAVSHRSQNVQWEGGLIAQSDWEKRNGHRGAVLWCTGYSGSGKSTVAKALVRELFAAGCQVMLLDGDNVRHGLCGDLGFSDRDRTENIRRVAETAKLFYEQGNLVVCTFISPFRADRAFARSIMPDGAFHEIFVKCDLEVCRRRDPKGLYRKAEAGEISEFTGVSSPYEAPEAPDLVLETNLHPVEDLVARVRAHLRDTGIVD